MNKDALRLIDKLYKDLYLDEQVLHHGTGNKYDKFNNIKLYLEKLEEMHNKVSEKGRIELLKKLYYEKYVIKKKDIPESYYEHQQEIALERGYGYVEITREDKKQYQEQIINNQKSSLDIWLDYFLSEDARVYPFWVKYWAFQGMLKLGTYNKEKGTFNKRTKHTIEPFADLNREALAMSIDMMIKLINKEEIDDKELENLVKIGSFQKIYTYILTKLLKDNKNITKRNIGKWIKYDQGSDHMPLVNSLQGYNTGWCTAGESTAKTQLQSGDFYVYYTLDEIDEYKVPRIAIRMEHGKIAEIRGIANDQNLESEMECVVEEKIKDFPDKEEYYKKVSDMKLLTQIYKRQKEKQELTKEELRFLYEIDGKIKGFGYGDDPRVEEIIKIRDSIKKDISYVLDCREDQVALEKNQLTNETIYYKGDIDLSESKSIEGLNLPQYIIGSLDLGGLVNVDKLVLPKKIEGSLDLGGLKSAEELILPEIIKGSLDLGCLKNINKIIFPKEVSGDLWLDSLTQLNDVALPDLIRFELFLSSLESAENLTLPSKCGTAIINRLSNMEGLILPYPLTYKIFLEGVKITPENVDQYRNNKKK